MSEESLAAAKRDLAKAERSRACEGLRQSFPPLEMLVSEALEGADDAKESRVREHTKKVLVAIRAAMEALK